MVFQPGQSGNPGGRPALPEDVKVRLRSLTAAAIDALERALASNDDRVRIAAATALMDRAWGKPAQQSDVTLTTAEARQSEELELLTRIAEAREREAAWTLAET